MTSKNLPKPKRVGLVWWDGLSKEEKYEAVLPYLKLQASNSEIADLLKLISPNAVARFRHLWNQRTHPENYDSTGKPISRQKKVANKKRVAPKPMPVTSESNVCKLSDKRPAGQKEPKKSFTVKPDPRAEHPPGESPVLQKIPDLHRGHGSGKNPAFPDDLDPADLRAIQKMYGDDT